MAKAASTTSRPDQAATTTQPADGQATISIGQYLIDRIGQLGVKHVFGIPGDYVLGLYKVLEHSPLKLVGVTREDSAGFAADAYARVHGVGCMCVTYCVGGLSASNSVAGAYAEKSPVIVLSGSPGLSERAKNPLLHHMVKNFETQHEVFKHLTVASAVLDNPETALAEIDRVLEAVVRYKRPVYLEVPRDLVHVALPAPARRWSIPEVKSDPDALREALDEAAEMLTAAKRPAILADVEVHRFHLQDKLVKLAERMGIPIATTILGKSVISEAHPLFAGIYQGAMGRPETTELIESADCLLMLGCFMTDINLGVFTAKLDPSRCIDATSEGLRIRHHHYQDVHLGDFIKGLIQRNPKVNPTPVPKLADPFADVDMGPPDSPTTSAKVFARLNQLLRKTSGTTVIADIGDSLFGATDLEMDRQSEFLSPAYYASMGFGLPAAVGAGIANPKSRVIVVVGDGAFQMTGMELSTIARNVFNPIVVVLNNHGYTTERFLLDGSFNDVYEWRFHKIPEVLGTGWGMEVKTVAELDEGVTRAWENTKSFSILNIHLQPSDQSPALRRLTERMSKIVDKRNPK